jgi:hypothetical protein
MKEYIAKPTTTTTSSTATTVNIATTGSASTATTTSTDEASDSSSIVRTEAVSGITANEHVQVMLQLHSAVHSCYSLLHAPS